MTYVQSYGSESVLGIIGSEKYGYEVIATQNCDKQYIIEPKNCDLELIRTEKVFL